MPFAAPGNLCSTPSARAAQPQMRTRGKTKPFHTEPTEECAALDFVTSRHRKQKRQERRLKSPIPPSRKKRGRFATQSNVSQPLAAGSIPFVCDILFRPHCRKG